MFASFTYIFYFGLKLISLKTLKCTKITVLPYIHLKFPNEIKDAMFKIIGINIMPVVPTAFLLAISPSPLMAENNPCCPH